MYLNFRKIIFYILVFVLIFPILFYLIGALTFLQVNAPLLIYSYNNGINDKSLNELSIKGIDRAFDSNEKGYNYSSFRTTSVESEMTNTFNVAIENGTKVIFIGGFEQFYWIEKYHDKLPDDVYLIYSDDSDKEFFTSSYSDVKSIYFDSSQASFVAGVVSSIYVVSKFNNPEEWKIGTWGGVPITAVINILSGFESGINFFNEFLLNRDVYKSDNVELISSRDEDEPSEWYSGSFNADEIGALYSSNLVDKGAKLLFPVAGAQTDNAMSIISGTKKDVMLVGIDADAKDLYPNSKEKVLTSVIKNFEKAAYESVQGVFEDDIALRDVMLTEDVEYGWENNGVYITDVEDESILNESYIYMLENNLFSVEASNIIEHNDLDSISKFINFIAIEAMEFDLINESSNTFIVN